MGRVAKQEGPEMTMVVLRDWLTALKGTYGAPQKGKWKFHSVTSGPADSINWKALLWPQSSDRANCLVLPTIAGYGRI